MGGIGKQMKRLTSESKTCPSCGANLIVGEIPQKDRHCYLGYVKTDTGYEPAPDDGRPLYFYRTIGVYDMDKDRTVAFECPDCGYRSER